MLNLFKMQSVKGTVILLSVIKKKKKKNYYLYRVLLTVRTDFQSSPVKTN